MDQKLEKYLSKAEVLIEALFHVVPVKIKAVMPEGEVAGYGSLDVVSTIREEDQFMILQ